MKVYTIIILLLLITGCTKTTVFPNGINKETHNKFINNNYVIINNNYEKQINQNIKYIFKLDNNIVRFKIIDNNIVTEYDWNNNIGYKGYCMYNLYTDKLVFNNINENIVVEKDCINEIDDIKNNYNTFINEIRSIDVEIGDLPLKWNLS